MPGTENTDGRMEDWEGGKRERKEEKKERFFRRKDRTVEEGRYLSDETTTVKRNICALI